MPPNNGLDDDFFNMSNSSLRPNLYGKISLDVSDEGLDDGLAKKKAKNTVINETPIGHPRHETENDLNETNSQQKRNFQFARKSLDDSLDRKSVDLNFRRTVNSSSLGSSQISHLDSHDKLNGSLTKKISADTRILPQEVSETNLIIASPRDNSDYQPSLSKDTMETLSRVKTRFQDALSMAESSNDLEPDSIASKPIIPCEANPDLSNRITLKIRPLDQKQTELKPLKFLMIVTHTFKRMMEVYCARQNIPFDQLVLTYRGTVVFPFSTPLILEISDGDELQACTKDTMRSIEKEREKLLTRSDSLSVDHLLEPVVTDGSLSRQSSSGNVLSDSFVNIRVRLQAQKKLEKYRLRKNRAFDVVLRKLSEKYGQENSKFVLQFDGDLVSPDATPDDLELEDGDLLEAIISTG